MKAQATALLSVTRDECLSADVAAEYRAPQLHEVGKLADVKSTSYGSTYDGYYAGRSYWYTPGF